MSDMRWQPGDDGPAPDGRRTPRRGAWLIECCGQPRAMLVPAVGTAAVLVCVICDMIDGCTSCGDGHGPPVEAVARLRDVWPRG